MRVVVVRKLLQNSWLRLPNFNCKFRNKLFRESRSISTLVDPQRLQIFKETRSLPLISDESNILDSRCRRIQQLTVASFSHLIESKHQRNAGNAQKAPNDELVTFFAFNKALTKIFLRPAIKAALTAVYLGVMRIFSSHGRRFNTFFVLRRGMCS